jgi:hypothetical protein
MNSRRFIRSPRRCGEQRVGHGEAERPERLCVDDKFESSDRAEIEKWWPIIKGANIRAD